MEYSNAYKNFCATYSAMAKALRDWVESKSGKITQTGDVVGLAEGNLIHFEKRNEQLIHLQDFAEAAEAERKRLLSEIQRLQVRCEILQTAAKSEKYNDVYIMQEVKHLLAWQIHQDNSLDDFRDILKETIFFLELALKRGLIESDETVEKKLIYARAFLKDDERLRRFFFQKKTELRETDKINIANEHFEAVKLSA